MGVDYFSWSLVLGPWSLSFPFSQLHSYLPFLSKLNTINMPIRIVSSIAITLSVFSLARSAAISLAPPTTAPDTASGPIDHSYIGFGIECASFPDYSGERTLEARRKALS